MFDYESLFIVPRYCEIRLDTGLGNGTKTRLYLTGDSGIAVLKATVASAAPMVNSDVGFHFVECK